MIQWKRRMKDPWNELINECRNTSRQTLVDEELRKVLCHQNCLTRMRNVLYPAPLVHVFLWMELDSVEGILPVLHGGHVGNWCRRLTATPRQKIESFIQLVLLDHFGCQALIVEVGSHRLRGEEVEDPLGSSPEQATLVGFCNSKLENEHIPAA